MLKKVQVFSLKPFWQIYLVHTDFQSLYKLGGKVTRSFAKFEIFF